MQNLSDSIRFRSIAVAFLGAFAFTYIHQFIVAESTYPVLKYFSAGDFAPFFYKAKEVAAGAEMYPNLTKPPLFILLLSPLLDYHVNLAARIFQYLSIGLILLSGALFCRSTRQGFWTQIAVLACLSTSWAFGFLIDRANADGLSMGLATLSVVSVAGQMPFLGWVLFALGLNIKSNILPLALPLFLRGRIVGSLNWGLGCMASILAVAALTPRWSLQWIEVASQRMKMLVNLDQSTSIYPAWLLLSNGETLATRFLMVTTTIIVAGIIFQNFYTKRPNPLLAFTLLLPCTYAYPALTYPYSMVLFPLLIFTYAFSSLQRGFWGLVFALFGYIGALGILAQAFPIYYWQRYLSAQWIGLVPSFGVSITLIANAILAWSPGLHRSAFVGESHDSPPTTLHRCGNIIGVVALLGLFSISTYAIVSYALSAPAGPITPGEISPLR